MLETLTCYVLQLRLLLLSGNSHLNFVGRFGLGTLMSALIQCKISSVLREELVHALYERGMCCCLNKLTFLM